MTTKICSKCNIEKVLHMFSLKDSKHNKFQNRCKICVSEVAKERGYNSGKYSQNEKEERSNRVVRGQCRVCKELLIPNKTVCKKHYIVDIANKALNNASSVIADELLERFEANPYCPYTGEFLTLGINAHLDHILSIKNRPDLKNDISNVEWVSETANLSKNGFNKDEFIEFCKLVAMRC